MHVQEDFYKKHPSAKEYMDDEHDWNPKFHLEHHGLKVFNIPFVPEDSEVFYMENEYDKEANLFIQENIELIREVFATKGLTFVYLPSIREEKIGKLCDIICKTNALTCKCCCQCPDFLGK